MGIRKWIPVRNVHTTAVIIVDVISVCTVPRKISIRCRDARAKIQTQIANIFDDILAIQENRSGKIIIVGVDDRSDFACVITDVHANSVAHTNRSDTT